MLRIFRKIRYDLMETNNITKYLKYAVGEILLIVIGILIAVQIHNWNENQRLENVKRDYFQLLLLDLEEDSYNINNRIIFAKERIAEYEAYEAKFRSLNPDISEIMAGLSQINTDANTLTFKTNTIEILNSTGDIKLMSNEIRNKIIDLSRTQTYLDHIIKRNTTLFLEQNQAIEKLGWSPVSDRLMNNPNLRELENGCMFSLEKSIQLIYAVESVYLFKHRIEKNIKEKYEALLVDIANLKNLIELELN